MSSPAESGRRKRSFRVGSVLVVTSFAIYPTYLVIALLPLTVKTRVFLGLAGWVMSWSLFSVGMALGGKDAVDYVKRLVTRRTAPRPK